VQRGDWSPYRHEDDRQSRDALATRDHWQAFQKVTETLDEAITGGAFGVPWLHPWANAFLKLFDDWLVMRV
jgi:hypothetical protein